MISSTHRTDRCCFVRSPSIYFILTIIFTLGLITADILTLKCAYAVPESEIREIPGKPPVDFPETIYESMPDISSSASEFIPTPDRWRQFYAGKWYDPYNQNVLKGDVPVFGPPDHPHGY